MSFDSPIKVLGDVANDYVDPTHQSLAKIQPKMSHYPLSFGQWLQVLAYALSKPREFAIVVDPDSADTQALLYIVREGYRPFACQAPVKEPLALGQLLDVN